MTSEQVSVQSRQVKDDDGTSHFPLILRAIGALAVVASAVVYMLQGLHGVDESLRHWVYLLIMAVLSGGGFGSQFLLKDSRGARLFFALAALLVPVQVTQLSAVLTNVIQASSATSISVLLGSGAIAVLLGSFAAFLCLSIFARPYARKLMLLYIVLNSLLFLPSRELWAIVFIAVAMISLVVYAYTRVLKKDHRLQLFEGIVIHTMLWVPVAILVSRSGFYVSEFFGACLLLLLGASAVWAACLNYIRYPLLKMLLVLSAYVMAVFANLGMIIDLSFGYPAKLDLPESLILYCLTIPPALFALIAGEVSKSRSFYRYLALAPLLALCVGVLFFLTGGELVLLSVMLLLSAVAVVIKSKGLLLGSVCIALLSVIMLVINFVENIESVSWLATACVGVVLVALSSLLERFGKVVQVQGRNRISALQSWSV